jgi:hypothetical protein
MSVSLVQTGEGLRRRSRGSLKRREFCIWTAFCHDAAPSSRLPALPTIPKSIILPVGLSFVIGK